MNYFFEKQETSNCGKFDVDLDRKVNPVDLGLVLRELGRNDCDEENNWCERANVDQDGVVDERDIELVVLFFGCSY